MKINIRKQEIEKMTGKRQKEEEEKEKKKKRRRREIFSILSKIHITSVMKDFDILLVCVVGYRMNLNINIHDI